LGGLGEAAQQFVRQRLIAAVLTNWDQVYHAASQQYLGLSSDSIRPYVTSTSVPNIISPLHLASQALCAEYVYPESQ
jgi:hypothetical protein